MKLRVIMLALTLSLMLSGCVGVNLVPSSMGGDMVAGEGDATERTYPNSPFSSAIIRGDFKVYYTKGDFDIRVELQENLFEYLTVDIQDGQLKIEPQASFNYRRPIDQGKVYITAPTLESLSLGGAVQLVQADRIEGESFRLVLAGASEAELSAKVDSFICTLSGASEAELDIVADQVFITSTGANATNLAVATARLEVTLSGASKMEADGVATELSLDGTGATDFGAEGLVCARAVASLSGSSSAELLCSDTLEVTLSGASTLRYVGDPTVTERVSGASKVVKVG